MKADNIYLKKYREAPFTSLSLPSYEGSAEILTKLLQWPKKLSHFHLPDVDNFDYEFEIPLLHSMLSIHRDTLTSLTIGWMEGYGTKGIFHASDFPNLEVLTLSRSTMMRKLEFSPIYADLLLAPKLKTFGLMFHLRDRPGEPCIAFKRGEQRWMIEFAKEAMKRKSTLREIEIIFDEDLRQVKAGCTWPCDCLDRIRDEIEPYGIRLGYDNPLIPEGFW